MGTDELAARIFANDPVFGRQQGQNVVVAAVEEHLRVGVGGLIAGDVGQRRVPVVARQDLVGALPGLHHLDRFADFLT